MIAFSAEDNSLSDVRIDAVLRMLVDYSCLANKVRIGVAANDEDIAPVNFITFSCLIR